jgi:hypothetical protein
MLISVSESKEGKNYPCHCCGEKNDNKDISLAHNNDFIHDMTIVLCESCLAELGVAIDRALVS